MNFQLDVYFYPTYNPNSKGALWLMVAQKSKKFLSYYVSSKSWMDFLCRFQKYKFFYNRMSSSLPSFQFKLASDPFISEKKLFGLQGSWYSNRPARTHGFNAKIGFEKYVPSPKILPKKCPKSAFQTKPAKFDTFWPISRDSMHIFQNRFLR